MNVTSSIDSLMLGPNANLNVAGLTQLSIVGNFANDAGKIKAWGGSEVSIGGGVSGTGNARAYLIDHNTLFHVATDMSGFAEEQVLNGATFSVSGLLSQTGLLNMDGIGTALKLGGLYQGPDSSLNMSNQVRGEIASFFNNDNAQVHLQSGSQLQVGGNFTGAAASRIYMTDPDTGLHVMGDLANGDGSAKATLQMDYRSTLKVDGTYRQTGSFSAVGVGTTVQTGGFAQDANSTLDLANVASAVVNGTFVSAGKTTLQSGATLVINSDLTGQSGSTIYMTDPDTLLRVNGNASTGDTQLTYRSRLEVSGDYEHIGIMRLDGTGTHFETGNFSQGAGSTLRLSHVADGLVNGDLTDWGGIVDLQTGASLIVTGSYSGRDDSFYIDGASTAAVFGNFALTGMFDLTTSGLPALVVGGDLTLDGLLKIETPDRDLPVNTLFPIITFAGSDTGGSNFSSFLFPVWDGLTFREVMGAHEVDLEVVAVLTPNPEPATWALFLSGLSLALLLKRHFQVPAGVPDSRALRGRSPVCGGCGETGRP